MAINALPLSDLTDEELLAQVKALATHERRATAQLIASLAELDSRRLFRAQGYSSLFAYCVQALHLSEHAAYGRIEAARVARKYPIVLEMLQDGAITLTTVCLLSRDLTQENHRAQLEDARHKTRRQVEEQVAALRPLPATPSSIRKLPHVQPVQLAAVAGNVPERHASAPWTSELSREATLPTLSVTATAAASPATVAQRRPAVISPLAPERYKVQITVSRECHDRLRRVQDLLRHAIPDGDPAVIFDRAIALLLKDLEQKKFAATERPRAGGNSPATKRSRHLPAQVRREVWGRDEGRCAFVGIDGRCTERGRLEFHHVIPFADGGPPTVDNIQLRCRAHNALESEAWFEWTVAPTRDRAPNGPIDG